LIEQELEIFAMFLPIYTILKERVKVTWDEENKRIIIEKWD